MKPLSYQSARGIVLAALAILATCRGRAEILYVTESNGSSANSANRPSAATSIL